MSIPKFGSARWENQRPLGVKVGLALFATGAFAFASGCASDDGAEGWSGVTHTFELVAEQRVVQIDDDVAYDGFTFNGTIPSEQFMVQEGDSVQIILRNEDTVAHGLSIHAADAQTSAHLGNVQAGQTATLTFLAKYPGVFMYHCAPGGHGIMIHTKAGQHGMIVVQPRNQRYGLEEELGRQPDLEVFMVQHEFYRDGRDFFDGKPLYVAFNGELFRYVKEPIRARPGDYVRFYYLNVGPNLTSTFHIVGGIFPYMHFQGNPSNVMVGGQSVTSGPTDSWVLEWQVPDEEGSYTLVSHAFGTQTAKGAIGIIDASWEHEARDRVIRSEGPSFDLGELAENGGSPDGLFRRVVRPFAPGSPDLDRPVRFDGETPVVIEMVGNSYVPKVAEVPLGTTVSWINEDVFDFLAFERTGLHNSVAIEGPVMFATDMLEHAQMDSITFTEPGEYTYICTMHPYMTGVVRVY